MLIKIPGQIKKSKNSRLQNKKGHVEFDQHTKPLLFLALLFVVLFPAWGFIFQ